MYSNFSTSSSTQIGQIALGCKLARAICPDVGYVLITEGITDFSCPSKLVPGKFDIYLTTKREFSSGKGMAPVIESVLHEVAHILFSFSKTDPERNKFRLTNVERILEEFVVNHKLLSGLFRSVAFNSIYENIQPDNSNVESVLQSALACFHEKGRFAWEKLVAIFPAEDHEFLQDWWQRVLATDDTYERKPLYKEFVERFGIVHKTPDFGITDAIPGLKEFASLFDFQSDAEIIPQSCTSISEEEAAELEAMTSDAVKELNNTLIKIQNGMDSGTYVPAGIKWPAGKPVIDQKLLQKLSGIFAQLKGRREEYSRFQVYGKFDVKSVHKLPIAFAAGNAPIWKRRNTAHSRKAVVGVLLDWSGSMSAYLPVAKRVCDTLASAASGTNLTVIGGVYTTFEDHVLKYSVGGMPDTTSIHTGGTPANEAVKEFDKLLANSEDVVSFMLHISDMEFSPAALDNLKSKLWSIPVSFPDDAATFNALGWNIRGGLEVIDKVLMEVVEILSVSAK